MKKAFKILGIGALVLFCLAAAALTVIGLVSPETYVYEGKKVPSRFVKKAEELGLVESGEAIKYLYSDAFLKLEEGVYVFTDNKIALFSSFWELEKSIIPYDTITELFVEYDDSMFGDSMITLYAGDDVEYFFPLSSEKGRDKKVVAWIEQKSGVTATASSYE